jgi:hypothetical protein
VATYSVYSAFVVDLPFSAADVDRCFSGMHLTKAEARANFERAFSISGEDKFFTDHRWCVRLLERFASGLRSMKSASENATLTYLIREFQNPESVANSDATVALAAAEFVPFYAGVVARADGGGHSKILKGEYRKIFVGYDSDVRLVDSMSEDYAWGFETTKRGNLPFGKISKAARTTCDALFSKRLEISREIDEAAYGWTRARRDQNWEATAAMVLKFLYLFSAAARGKGWHETLGDELFEEALDEYLEIGPFELLGGTRRRRAKEVSGIFESVSTSALERSDYSEHFEFLEDVPSGYYETFLKSTTEEDEATFRRDDFRSRVLKVSKWDGNVATVADASLFNWVLYVHPWTGSWAINYTDRFPSSSIPAAKRETVVVDRLPFYYATDDANDRDGAGKLAWTSIEKDSDRPSYDARNFVYEGALKIDAGFDQGSGERTYALWSVSDLIYSAESGTSPVEEPTGAFYSRRLLKVVKFSLSFDPFSVEVVHAEGRGALPKIRVGLGKNENWVRKPSASEKSKTTGRRKKGSFVEKLSVRSEGDREISIEPFESSSGSIVVDAYALSVWKDVRTALAHNIEGSSESGVDVTGLVDEEKGDVVESVDLSGRGKRKAVENVAKSTYDDMKFLIALDDIAAEADFSIFDEEGDERTLNPKSVDAMRRILENGLGAALVRNPGKCTETTCEAVAKSKNVSDAVRLEAYRISLISKLARAAVERSDREDEAKNALAFLILEARLISRISLTYRIDSGFVLSGEYEDDNIASRWLRSDGETMRRFLSSLLNRESPHLAVAFEIAKRKAKTLAKTDAVGAKGWELRFTEVHSLDLKRVLSSFIDEHAEGWKSLLSADLSDEPAAPFPETMASFEKKGPRRPTSTPPSDFRSSEEERSMEEEREEEEWHRLLPVKLEGEPRIDVSPQERPDEDLVSRTIDALRDGEELTPEQSELLDSSFESKRDATIRNFVKEAYATPKIRESDFLATYLETVDAPEVNGEKLESLVDANVLVNLSLADVSEIYAYSAASQTPLMSKVDFVQGFLSGDAKDEIETRPGFCRFLTEVRDFENEGSLSKWAYYAAFCACAAMMKLQFVDRSGALAKISDLSIFDERARDAETSFAFALAGLEGIDLDAASTDEERREEESKTQFLIEKATESHDFLKPFLLIFRNMLNFSDPDSFDPFTPISQAQKKKKKRPTEDEKRGKVKTWTVFFRNRIEETHRGEENKPTVEGSLQSACLTLLFGASVCALCLRTVEKCIAALGKSGELFPSDTFRAAVSKAELIDAWEISRSEFRKLYADLRREYVRISFELATFVYGEMTKRLEDSEILIAGLSPSEIEIIEEEGKHGRENEWKPERPTEDDEAADDAWEWFSSLKSKEFEKAIDRTAGMSMAFQKIWESLLAWLNVKRSWHESNLARVLLEPLEKRRKEIEREERDREDRKERDREDRREEEQILREREASERNSKKIKKLSIRFDNAVREQTKTRFDVNMRLASAEKDIETAKRKVKESGPRLDDDEIELLTNLEGKTTETRILVDRVYARSDRIQEELDDRLDVSERDPRSADMVSLEKAVEDFEEIVKEDIGVAKEISDTVEKISKTAKTLGEQSKASIPSIKREHERSETWFKIVERLATIETAGFFSDFDLPTLTPREKVAGAVPGFDSDEGKETLSTVADFLSRLGADGLTEDHRLRISDAVKRGYEFENKKAKEKSVGESVIDDLKSATNAVYPILSKPGFEGQRAEFVFSLCSVYLEAVVFKFADGIALYLEDAIGNKTNKNIRTAVLEFIRLFLVSVAPISNKHFLFHLAWVFFETFSTVLGPKKSWTTVGELKPILPKISSALKTYAYFSFVATKGIRFYYDKKTDTVSTGTKVFRYDHYGLLAVASRFSTDVDLGEVPESLVPLKREMDVRLERIKDLTLRFTPATPSRTDKGHNYIEFGQHTNPRDRIYPAFWWFIELLNFNLSIARVFEIEIKSNIFPSSTEAGKGPKSSNGAEPISFLPGTLNMLYDNDDATVENELYVKEFYETFIYSGTVPLFTQALKFLSKEDEGGFVSDPKTVFDLVTPGNLELIYKEMYDWFSRSADPETDPIDDLKFLIDAETGKGGFSVTLGRRELSMWVALRSARLAMTMYSFTEIESSSEASSRTGAVYLRIRNSRALLVNSLVYYGDPEYVLSTEEVGVGGERITISANVSPRFKVSVGPSSTLVESNARKTYWKILFPGRPSGRQLSPYKSPLVQGFAIIGPKIPSPYSQPRGPRIERSDAESRTRDLEADSAPLVAPPDPFYFWMSLKILGDIDPNWLFEGRTADDVLPSSRLKTVEWRARFLRKDVATGKTFDPEKNRWGVAIDEVPSENSRLRPAESTLGREDATAKKIRESREVRNLMRRPSNADRPLYLVLLEASHRERAMRSDHSLRNKEHVLPENETLREFLSKMTETKIRLEQDPDSDAPFHADLEKDVDGCDHILRTYGRFANICPTLSNYRTSYVNRFTGFEEFYAGNGVFEFCEALCGKKNVSRLKSEMSMDPSHRPFDLPQTLRRLLDRDVVSRMLFWCKAVVDFDGYRDDALKIASLDALSESSESSVETMEFYDAREASRKVSVTTKNGYEFVFSFPFPEDGGDRSQHLASWFYEETEKRFADPKFGLRVDFDAKNSGKMFLAVIDEDSILHKSTRKSRFLLKATYRQISYVPALEAMLGVDLLGNAEDPEADLLFVKDRPFRKAYPPERPTLPLAIPSLASKKSDASLERPVTFVGRFDDVVDRFENPSLFDPFDGLEDAVIRFFDRPGIPSEGEFNAEIFDAFEIVRDADLIVTEG